MHSTNLVTFKRQTGNPNSALHEKDTWGCPECGDECFSVVENFSARVSGIRTMSCSWYDADGGYDTDDVMDEEHHDTDDYDGGDWETGELECYACGHVYSYGEAEEAYDEAQEYDDPDEDDEDGETTEWPGLANAGVERADVVGALLLQQVPFHDEFTLEERAGKTVIGVKPSYEHGGRYGSSDGHQVERCTQCSGDMSTQYMRITSLPHKQSRYAMSSQELHSVRFEAPIELHVPICYVCHTAK